MANLSFQGTTGKRSLPVPSALRALAAPELKRLDRNPGPRGLPLVQVKDYDGTDD
jgi:hypothetical protein